MKNANGLGRHLAQWLGAPAETVVDVPASATGRVRQLTRGGGRNNDRIDAAAAATAYVPALLTEGRPVHPSGGQGICGHSPHEPARRMHQQG